MKSKNNNKKENYLDRKPIINHNLKWNVDENGAVTIEIENNKIADRILQKLIKKPKVSYIHLDEMGNFVWRFIDGERTVLQIAQKVGEHFGKEAEPLYERLIRYFEMLENCGFTEWNMSDLPD